MGNGNIIQLLFPGYEKVMLIAIQALKLQNIGVTDLMEV
jgi:hypothetical protein